MLWALALLLAVLPPGSQTSSSFEGRMILVTRSPGSYVEITCDLASNYISWYKFKEGQAPQYLLYYNTLNSKIVWGSGITSKKYGASKGARGRSKFTVRNPEGSDSAVYYCAYWNYEKVFGVGTKLIVMDKSPDADISPKPTIFLPSVAETNLHKAGTYLCLLENFFPDVIKVYWKEKDGNRILESQQGNTMKTKDTFMMMSWLTVTGESMNKEHRCIVKHEKNKGGVDQEILFPAINQVVTTMKPTEVILEDENAVTTINPREADLKVENDAQELQLTYTSAYWTYLLLLLKSVVYLAIVTFCLLRRTAVSGKGKSS